MKRIIVLICFLVPAAGFAQFGINIAVKAGVNFANITNASQINADTRTGYMIGGYISPKSKKGIGYRSEIILSRQGYDYRTSTNTGNVNLDYLLLPQLLTLNFASYVQLHIGLQAAVLLNAEVDSTNGNDGGSLLSYFNRFDYGIVAGGEIFPLRKWLFLGARINVGLNNLSQGNSNQPNFIPKVDAKSNVIQVYAGWRF